MNLAQRFRRRAESERFDLLSDSTENQGESQ